MNKMNHWDGTEEEKKRHREWTASAFVYCGNKGIFLFGFA